MKRCDRLNHHTVRDGRTTNPQKHRGVYVNKESAAQPIPCLLSQERTQDPSGATVAGKTDSQSNISVSVIVKRKNPLDLEKMIGRHLSQEEFSEKYAADPASFDHLREFAHKHGLTVDEGASSLARRTGPARAGQ